MKLLRSMLDALVFSNLFIALGAVSLLWCSYLIIGHQIRFDSLSWLIFLSTWAGYSLIRLNALREDPELSQSPLLAWTAKHKKFMITTVAVCCLGCVFFFLQQVLYVQLAMIATALISWLYVAPFTDRKFWKIRLRELPMIKTFIVAVTWVIATVVVACQGMQSETVYYWMIIERFTFILALTIPFDIRDAQFDSEAGITTFAGKYGVKSTKIIAIVLLLIWLALHALFTYVFWSLTGHFAGFVPATVVCILAILIILNLHENRSEYWYTLGLDSLLIVYFGVSYLLLN